MGFFSGALGSIGSALLGGIGAKKQQDVSKEMAREQMAFQERMSNTAHQRQVKDLRAAGLNPILSTNTGASSPGGAMGVAQNVLGTAVDKAMTARQLAANVELTEAQTGKVRAETNPVAYIQQIVDDMGVSYDNLPSWVKKIAENLGVTAKDLVKSKTPGKKGEKHLNNPSTYKDILRSRRNPKTKPNQEK